jgi:hypothetical protein
MSSPVTTTSEAASAAFALVDPRNVRDAEAMKRRIRPDHLRRDFVVM